MFITFGFYLYILLEMSRLSFIYIDFQKNPPHIACEYFGSIRMKMVHEIQNEPI